jgi:hypothetical protein
MFPRIAPPGEEARRDYLDRGDFSGVRGCLLRPYCPGFLDYRWRPCCR